MYYRITDHVRFEAGLTPASQSTSGGCRALGLLYSGKEELAGLMSKDVTKYCFFEGGWYQRIVQALPEWTNLSEIGAR